MLIKVGNISFALGEFEPFFCSLALYNIETKQKLSENFYFDTNNNDTLKFLNLQVFLMLNL